MPEPYRRRHLWRGIQGARQTHRRHRRPQTPQNGKGERGLPDHVAARNQHATQGSTSQHRDRTRDRRRQQHGQNIHRDGLRRARSEESDGDDAAQEAALHAGRGIRQITLLFIRILSQIREKTTTQE